MSAQKKMCHRLRLTPEGTEMSESHQNPALLGPAAPRMTAFAGGAEYLCADYPESELNIE